MTRLMKAAVPAISAMARDSEIPFMWGSDEYHGACAGVLQNASGKTITLMGGGTTKVGGSGALRSALNAPCSTTPPSDTPNIFWHCSSVFEKKPVVWDADGDASLLTRDA